MLWVVFILPQNSGFGLQADFAELSSPPHFGQPMDRCKAKAKQPSQRKGIHL
jgi:hypothetical protein